MILQSDAFRCGPIACSNAIYAITGKRTAPKAIARHAGTTPEDGTTHWGLMQAVSRLGFKHEELSAAFPVAVEALREWLEGGGSAVLLTESGNHWEAAVGVLGKRILVFNSTPPSGWSGLMSLSKAQLRHYWTSGGTDGRYGLLISR